MVRCGLDWICASDFQEEPVCGSLNPGLRCLNRFRRGVVIDDKKEVNKIMEEYWTPMWNVSYQNLDVDVQLVMDGLGIDRSAPSRYTLSAEDRKRADTDKRRYSVGVPIASNYYDTSLEHGGIAGDPENMTIER